MGSDPGGAIPGATVDFQTDLFEISLKIGSIDWLDRLQLTVRLWESALKNKVTFCLPRAFIPNTAKSRKG